MILFIDVFLSVVLLFLLGRLIVSLILPPESLGRYTGWGLSYLLGSGAMALWMFLIGSLRLPLSLPLIFSVYLLLIAGVVFAKNKAGLFCEPVVSSRSESLNAVEILLKIYIGVTVVSVLVLGLLLPIFHWDPVASIAFDGKVLFWERSLVFQPNLPHAAYPLQVPLLEAYSAVVAGVWDGRMVKMIFQAYFLSFFLVEYGFLRRFLAKNFALLGVALTLTAPYLIFHATTGYMDLVLMAYLCSSFFMLMIAAREKSPHWHLLAGLLGGMGAFVKPEGAHYFFILSVFCAVASLSEKRGSVRAAWNNIAVYVLPGLAVIGWHKIYNGMRGIAPLAYKQIVFDAAKITRLDELIRVFAYNIFATNNWGGNWLFFVVCAVVLFWWRYREERWLLAGIVAFSAAVLLGLCFTESYQYVFPKDVAFSRLLLHFFPLVPVFCTFCLARVFDRKRG